MTRKEAKKLEFLQVPQGLKMKYQHYYKTPDGHPAVKVEGEWQNTTNDDEIVGTVKLDSTYAWLENAKGEVVAEGEALCNPKDTPNKKLGRCIAHNRAVKAWLNSRSQENPLDSRLRIRDDQHRQALVNEARGDLAFMDPSVH